MSENLKATLVVYSAGSLRKPLPMLCSELEAVSGMKTELVLGPAGLLRRRIEAEVPQRCGLFISADLTQAQALAAFFRARRRQSVDVVPWVGNELMILYPARGAAAELIEKLSADPAQKSRPLWLRLLAAPGVRIGTSTPHADPAGDYAAAFFNQTARWDPKLPGELLAKSTPVVGGSIPSGKPVLRPVDMLLAGKCDVYVGYAHERRTLERRGDVRVLVPPRSENIECRYALVPLSEAGCKAAAFLRHSSALELLGTNGFLVPSVL